MYKLLSEYLQTNTLLAIYTNKDNEETFAVGYINQLTEEEVIILHVGLHGEYDGYSACYIDDIFKIETNTKYLNKINILKDGNNTEKLTIITTDNDCFTSLITTAMKNRNIIAIGCSDLDMAIIGFLKSNLDDTVIVSQINEYGEQDGEAIICKDSINKIVIDDVECREIEKLYSHHRDCGKECQGDGSVDT